MRSVERMSRSGRESSADDIRQRLRDLPGERQAPYDWTEFRRRERGRTSRRRYPVKWEHAAAAAGIAALVASMAMWGRADHQLADVAPSGVATAPLSASRTADPELGTQAPADTTPSGAGEEPDGTPLSNEGINEDFNAAARHHAAEASLLAQAAVAAQLAALARGPGSKRWLEHHPLEPTVARVGARLAVANLEDRIAWVDDALTDTQFAAVNTSRTQALEEQRARLVSSLAQVRYAETLAAQTR